MCRSTLQRWSYSGVWCRLLSSHHLYILKGVLSRTVHVCVSISEHTRGFMDAVACETLSPLVYREGLSESAGCLTQSCCPLVCEGFIIELTQAVWPNSGDMLSSTATLLTHYMWKKVRQTSEMHQKCVVYKTDAGCFNRLSLRLRSHVLLIIPLRVVFNGESWVYSM